MGKFNINSYHAVRDQMHAAFPSVFPERGQSGSPLAINIHVDILAQAPSHGISRTKARLFLAVWTRRREYLEALVAGQPRCSLDGAVTDLPTEAERKAASHLLARRSQAQHRRRQAQQSTAPQGSL